MEATLAREILNAGSQIKQHCLKIGVWMGAEASPWWVLRWEMVIGIIKLLWPCSVPFLKSLQICYMWFWPWLPSEGWELPCLAFPPGESSLLCSLVNLSESLNGTQRPSHWAWPEVIFQWCTLILRSYTESFGSLPYVKTLKCLLERQCASIMLYTVVSIFM